MFASSQFVPQKKVASGSVGEYTFSLYFFVGFSVGDGVTGFRVGAAVSGGVGKGVGEGVGKGVGEGVGKGVGEGVGKRVGEGVGEGVIGCGVLFEADDGPFCADSAIEAEDGLGFPPPTGLFLPPEGLENDEPLEGAVGFLVGLPVGTSTGDIVKEKIASLSEGATGFWVGWTVVSGASRGDLVTEKNPSKTEEVSSTGEFVGSIVVPFMGNGEGGTLFSLHCGDHTALSLQ